MYNTLKILILLFFCLQKTQGNEVNQSDFKWVEGVKVTGYKNTKQANFVDNVNVAGIDKLANKGHLVWKYQGNGAWAQLSTTIAPNRRPQDDELIKKQLTGIIGHSSVLFGDKLVVYGGIQSLTNLNDIVVHRTSSTVFAACLSCEEGLQWEILETSGAEPESRAYHSAVVYNDSMYIYGGITVPLVGEKRVLNDIWRIGKDRVWKKLDDGGTISGRFGHTATIVGNEMLIFGGTNDISLFRVKEHPPVFPEEAQQNSLLDNLWKWSLENNSEWNYLETQTTNTPATAFHSMTYWDKEDEPYLILFGGIIEQDSKYTASSQLWIISFESDFTIAHWDKPTISTRDLTVSLTKYGHSTFLESSRIFIFGGWELTANSNWKLDDDILYFEKEIEGYYIENMNPRTPTLGGDVRIEGSFPKQGEYDHLEVSFENSNSDIDSPYCTNIHHISSALILCTLSSGFGTDLKVNLSFDDAVTPVFSGWGYQFPTIQNIIPPSVLVGGQLKIEGNNLGENIYQVQIIGSDNAPACNGLEVSNHKDVTCDIASTSNINWDTYTYQLSIAGILTTTISWSFSTIKIQEVSPKSFELLEEGIVQMQVDTDLSPYSEIYCVFSNNTNQFVTEPITVGRITDDSVECDVPAYAGRELYVNLFYSEEWDNVTYFNNALLGNNILRFSAEAQIDNVNPSSVSVGVPLFVTVEGATISEETICRFSVNDNLVEAQANGMVGELNCSTDQIIDSSTNNVIIQVSNNNGESWISRTLGVIVVPELTRIDPQSGSSDSVVILTVYGSNFPASEDLITVFFGTHTLTNCTIRNLESIECSLPPGRSGYVDIKVTKNEIDFSNSISYFAIDTVSPACSYDSINPNPIPIIEDGYIERDIPWFPVLSTDSFIVSPSVLPRNIPEIHDYDRCCNKLPALTNPEDKDKCGIKFNSGVAPNVIVQTFPPSVVTEVLTAWASPQQHLPSTYELFFQDQPGNWTKIATRDTNFASPTACDFISSEDGYTLLCVDWITPRIIGTGIKIEFVQTPGWLTEFEVHGRDAANFYTVDLDINNPKWVSDSSRFSFDQLKVQIVDTAGNPYRSNDTTLNFTAVISFTYLDETFDFQINNESHSSFDQQIRQTDADLGSRVGWETIFKGIYLDKPKVGIYTIFVRIEPTIAVQDNLPIPEISATFEVETGKISTVVSSFDEEKYESEAETIIEISFNAVDFAGNPIIDKADKVNISITGCSSSGESVNCSSEIGVIDDEGEASISVYVFGPPQGELNMSFIAESTEGQDRSFIAKTEIVPGKAVGLAVNDISNGETEVTCDTEVEIKEIQVLFVDAGGNMLIDDVDTDDQEWNIELGLLADIGESYEVLDSGTVVNSILISEENPIIKFTLKIRSPKAGNFDVNFQPVTADENMHGTKEPFTFTIGVGPQIFGLSADYSLDTEFQIKGSASAVSPITLKNISLSAVDRCGNKKDPGTDITEILAVIESPSNWANETQKSVVKKLEELFELEILNIRVAGVYKITFCVSQEMKCLPTETYQHATFSITLTPGKVTSFRFPKQIGSGDLKSSKFAYFSTFSIFLTDIADNVADSVTGELVSISLLEPGLDLYYNGTLCVDTICNKSSVNGVVTFEYGEFYLLSPNVGTYNLKLAWKESSLARQTIDLVEKSLEFNVTYNIPSILEIIGDLEIISISGVFGEIKIKVLDLSGNSVQQNENYVIEASIETLEVNTSNLNQPLYPVTFITQDTVSIQQGVATFPRLQFSGAWGYKYKITFQAVIGSETTAITVVNFTLPNCANLLPNSVSDDSLYTCVCDAGYSKVSGTDTCAACGKNDFKETKGNEACTPCGLKMKTLNTSSTSVDDCFCEDGWFSLGSFHCSTCDSLDGAVCSDGQFEAAQGFWKDNSSSFTECLFDVQCEEGGCRTGHTGYLCSECEEGYGFFGRVCEECPSEGINIFLFLFLLVAFHLVITVLVFRASKQTTSYTVIFKIFITYLQITAFIGGFGVGWPSEFTTIFQVAETSNFNLNLLSVDCTTKWTGFQRFVFFVFLPIYSVFLGFIFGAFAYWRKRKELEALRKKEAWTFFSLTVLVCIYLFYPAICKITFEMLTCVTIGEESRVYTDLNYLCDGNSFRGWKIFSVVILIVYVMGIPAGLLFVLWKTRELIKTGETTPSVERKIKMFRFLVGGYITKRYYWDLVILSRKILFIAALLFLREETGIQLTVALMITFAALIGQIFGDPFKSVEARYYEITAIMANYITLMFALLFYTETGLSSAMKTFLVAVMAIMNFAVLLGGLYLLLQDRVKLFRKKYQEKTAKSKGSPISLSPQELEDWENSSSAAPSNEKNNSESSSSEKSE